MKINKDFLSLDKEDTYSIMLMLLYASTDNPRFSTLSELAYVLDHDSFLKFVKYFEGQTIEIPTIQTMTDSLKVLMLFQYYRIDKLGWHDAIKKAGFSETDSFSAKHKLDKLCNQLERYNYRLGGLIKPEE